MTIYNKPSIRELSSAEERLSDLIEWAFDEAWRYCFHAGPMYSGNTTERILDGEYPNGKIVPITIIEIAAQMAMVYGEHELNFWIDYFCLEDGE